MAAEPVGNWWDVEPEYEGEEPRRARRQDASPGRRGFVGRFSALLGLTGSASEGRLLDISLDDPAATGELPAQVRTDATPDAAPLQASAAEELAGLRTLLEERLSGLEERVGELAKEARRRDRRTAAQLLYAELRSFERALRKAGHGEGAVFHQVQRVNDFIRWIEGDWEPTPLADEARRPAPRKSIGLRDAEGRIRR